MAGEIIRKGDPTSHGGIVLEGSEYDICHGQPISYIGHKTFCPKCKGTFIIIEGVTTATFYGSGVALAGMKTSCGAILIATQFTDTVFWPVGSKAEHSTSNVSTAVGLATPILFKNQNGLEEDFLYDQHFQLKDKHTDEILKNRLYRIHYSGGIIEGRTNDDGYTKKVFSNIEEKIKIEIFAEGA